MREILIILFGVKCYLAAMSTSEFQNQAQSNEFCPTNKTSELRFVFIDFMIFQISAFSEADSVIRNQNRNIATKYTLPLSLVSCWLYSVGSLVVQTSQCLVIFLLRTSAAVRTT